MATNSVKFRIDGDGSGAMRALTDFRRGVRAAGDDVQKYLQGKLSTLIAPVAIEEAVRRTAEWATELRNSAQQIGISTDELQALRLAAQRAGVASETVVGYYASLAGAAQQAIDGNEELRASLNRLGIDSSKLKTITGPQMFGAISGTIGGKEISPRQATDLSKLFGENELQNLAAIFGVLGGKSMSAYSEANQGKIVPSVDIQDIAATWNEFLEALKEAGIQLIPAAKLLLKIATGLMKEVAGLADFATHLTGGLYNLMFGKKTIGQFQTEMRPRYEAAAKGFAGALTLGRYEPTPTAGLSKHEQELAEGAGAGMVSLAGGALIKNVVSSRMALGARIKDLHKSRNELEKALDLKKISNAELIPMDIAATGLVGYTGAQIASGAKQSFGEIKSLKFGTVTPNRLLTINPSAFGGAGGGGGANLRIGGVFGVDLSMKIISLNQRMVELLQQLVVNTDQLRGSKYAQTLLGNQ